MQEEQVIRIRYSSHSISTIIHTGVLPITTGSTCSGAGGYSDNNSGQWDYSSQTTTGGTVTTSPNFMQFLVSSGFLSKQIVDPVNNMTGDANGGYAYRYFCYTSGSGYTPGPTLQYWSENTGSLITITSGDSALACS